MGSLKKVAEHFKSGNKNLSKKGKQSKFAKVMSEFKHGKLHSGRSGKMVTSRAQAQAIAASESGMMRR